MHSDSKKRRSFLALLFAASEAFLGDRPLSMSPFPLDESLIHLKK
jgi:hypothetical protein